MRTQETKKHLALNFLFGALLFNYSCCNLLILLYDWCTYLSHHIIPICPSSLYLFVPPLYLNVPFVKMIHLFA